MLIFKRTVTKQKFTRINEKVETIHQIRTSRTQRTCSTDPICGSYGSTNTSEPEDPSRYSKTTYQPPTFKEKKFKETRTLETQTTQTEFYQTKNMSIDLRFRYRPPLKVSMNYNDAEDRQIWKEICQTSSKNRNTFPKNPQHFKKTNSTIATNTVEVVFKSIFQDRKQSLISAKSGTEAAQEDRNARTLDMKLAEELELGGDDDDDEDNDAGGDDDEDGDQGISGKLRMTGFGSQDDPDSDESDDDGSDSGSDEDEGDEAEEMNAFGEDAENSGDFEEFEEEDEDSGSDDGESDSGSGRGSGDGSDGGNEGGSGGGSEDASYDAAEQTLEQWLIENEDENEDKNANNNFDGAGEMNGETDYQDCLKTDQCDGGQENEGDGGADDGNGSDCFRQDHQSNDLLGHGDNEFADSDDGGDDDADIEMEMYNEEQEKETTAAVRNLLVDSQPTEYGESGLLQIFNQMLAELIVDTDSNNSYWHDNKNDFEAAYGGGESGTDNNMWDFNNGCEDDHNDGYQEVTQDTYFYGGGASEEL